MTNSILIHLSPEYGRCSVRLNQNSRSYHFDATVDCLERQNFFAKIEGARNGSFQFTEQDSTALGYPVIRCAIDMVRRENVYFL